MKRQKCCGSFKIEINKRKIKWDMSLNLTSKKCTTNKTAYMALS